METEEAIKTIKESLKCYLNLVKEVSNNDFVNKSYIDEHFESLYKASTALYLLEKTYMETPK